MSRGGFLSGYPIPRKKIPNPRIPGIPKKSHPEANSDK